MGEARLRGCDAGASCCCLLFRGAVAHRGAAVARRLGCHEGGEVLGAGGLAGAAAEGGESTAPLRWPRCAESEAVQASCRPDGGHARSRFREELCTHLRAVPRSRAPPRPQEDERHQGEERGKGV